MIIVGAYRSDGEFTDDNNKNIVYDNTYVHAISGDDDKYEKQCSVESGKFTDSYKIKTELFLNAFKDLKNPFDECRGLNVLPFYDKKGNCTGFIRQG